MIFEFFVFLQILLKSFSTFLLRYKKEKKIYFLSKNQIKKKKRCTILIKNFLQKKIRLIFFYL